MSEVDRDSYDLEYGEDGDSGAYMSSIGNGEWYHESAVRELVEALRDWKNEVGECTCHEAYTGRKLTDPNCHYHDYGEVREETDDLLTHYKELSDE